MSTRRRFFQALLLVQCVLLILAEEQMQFGVIRQWKYINYTWPSAELYQTATDNGQYNPQNIVLAGVIYFDGWYYLTMPRMKDGVPVTLGKISATPEKVINPLIAPFPSWEYNKLGNCDVLQNVQNVEIDLERRMWIIDGGHAASLTKTPIRNCSPKLIIFDLNTNTTTHVHTFSEAVAAKNGSFLYDLVIDNEYAYITDNSRYDPGIIVFHRKSNQSWKIRDRKSMQADPSAQNFTVNDISISSPVNIAGIALTPNIGNSTDRQIYYSPISSLHLYCINTSTLQNQSNSLQELRAGDVKDVGLKASQTDGMIMTNNEILYYGLLSDNSIAQWDSHLPFVSNQKILSRDTTYIQWTNSFTIDTKGNIIVLTNTLQEFIYNKVNVNQTNFWLISAYTGQKSYLYDKSSDGDHSVAARNTTPTNTSSSDVSSPDETGVNVVIKNIYSTSSGNHIIVYPLTSLTCLVLLFFFC